MSRVYFYMNKSKDLNLFLHFLIDVYIKDALIHQQMYYFRYPEIYRHRATQRAVALYGQMDTVIEQHRELQLYMDRWIPSQSNIESCNFIWIDGYLHRATQRAVTLYGQMDTVIEQHRELYLYMDRWIPLQSNIENCSFTWIDGYRHRATQRTVALYGQMDTVIEQH